MIALSLSVRRDHCWCEACLAALSHWHSPKLTGTVHHGVQNKFGLS